MILFAAYAAVVWYLAFRWRRRVVGALLVVGCAVPPFAVTTMVSAMNRADLDTGWYLLNNMKGYGAVLHIFSVPYALLVASVAGVAFCQRRTRPAVTCPSCHYDLAGNATGQCPECGAMLPREFIERIARVPVVAGGMRLPEYASEEEARLAGERSVRRVTLPEHLRRDGAGGDHDVLKYGASRARPHAEAGASSSGEGGSG